MTPTVAPDASGFPNPGWYRFFCANAEAVSLSLQEPPAMTAPVRPAIGSPEWIAEQKKLRDKADAVISFIYDQTKDGEHSPIALLTAVTRLFFFPHGGGV